LLCKRYISFKHCPVHFTYSNTFKYKSFQYYSFISIFPIGFSIKVLYAFSPFSIPTILYVQLTIFLTNFWCILSFIFFLHSILTMLFLTSETWKASGYISHLYKTSSKTIIFCLLPYYVMFGKSQRVKRHAVAYPRVWDKRCTLQTWRVAVNILSKHIMESWEGVAIKFRVWMQVCKVPFRIFQGNGREANRTD
jgi:glucan phosphoethanolaminetransferase (alkaline phosphatase superfamily)